MNECMYDMYVCMYVYMYVSVVFFCEYLVCGLKDRKRSRIQCVFGCEDCSPALTPHCIHFMHFCWCVAITHIHTHNNNSNNSDPEYIVFLGVQSHTYTNTHNNNSSSSTNTYRSATLHQSAAHTFVHAIQLAIDCCRMIDTAAVMQRAYSSSHQH